MLQIRSSIIGAMLFAAGSVNADLNEYISADQLPWLASALKEELTKNGCKIPSRIDSFLAAGVVVGQFAAPGQLDLAVLCVTDKESYILVKWGGSKTCPRRLDSFGQSITAVGESYIWRHYDAYGGRKPPKIDHEGVNDHVLGKASVVRYCMNGNWIDLTGAD